MKTADTRGTELEVGQEVIVAHGKYGTDVYRDALTLLKERYEEGYWYYNDENDRWEDRARDIIRLGDEEKAWYFLLNRSGAEYEYVEKQAVN